MRSEKFDAVIFDMDGTLVEPLLDFQAIRAELGIGADEGIIETISAMPRDEAQAAHRKLLAHELAAAREATLMAGAVETLDAVRAAGLKTALLTRNAREAMEIVLARYPLTFDLPWSRDCGVTKPEPDGVLSACRELGVRPERTACVGDFRYDIQAANAAGAVSVLLATGERPSFADQADFVMTALADLTDVLEIRAPSDR